MQIASNGSTFNCRIDGGSGPWVMLAHGLATDLAMWDELTEALKDRYRVLRYDARGHGGSPATEGDYSLDMLVADAVGILDMLGNARHAKDLAKPNHRPEQALALFAFLGGCHESTVELGLIEA